MLEPDPDRLWTVRPKCEYCGHRNSLSDSRCACCSAPVGTLAVRVREADLKAEEAEERDCPDDLFQHEVEESIRRNPLNYLKALTMALEANNKGRDKRRERPRDP